MFFFQVVCNQDVSGHEEIAIRLMDEGAGVEGGDGSTPLHWAVDSNSGRGSWSVLRIIICGSSHLAYSSRGSKLAF